MDHRKRSDGMFTGIVETTGCLSEIREDEAGVTFVIEAPMILEDLRLGDSVSVDGVCLTATALMEHALAFLDARGVRTMRLDATPMGQPVYEKLGFVAEYQLARWEGVLPASSPASDTGPVSRDDIEDVIWLDYEVTGTDRGKLLARLHEERPDWMRLVRRDGTPRELPTAADFGGDNPDLGATYEAAWLACRLLAQRYGEPRLVRFYHQVDQGADTAAAFRAVLGTTEVEFTRTWRDELADLASAS